MAAGKDQGRQDQQPGYVLHTYPFRETSLVVETYTRSAGRVAVVARGARRPRSALRGVLLAFQPLLLSWSGKSDLHTLIRAEWQGGYLALRGRSLMCGFYLNELLLKLLARHDPHEALYDAYAATLAALARDEDPARILRSFEKKLLGELGYALTLDQDVETGRPVAAERTYTYVIERGPVPLAAEPSANGLELAGQTLLDMQRDDYSSPVTQLQSKALMRMLINHLLGDQVLHTRQLLRDLQQL